MSIASTDNASLKAAPQVKLDLESTESAVTDSYSMFNSSLAMRHRTARTQPFSTLQGRRAFPFPKPTTGHICTRCEHIPLEIFQIGSNFFSERCKGRHLEERNCKGNHLIHCDHCGEQIQEPFYHCGVCKNGDYDVCGKCKSEGKRCHEKEHRLAKRVFDNGIIREVDEEDESYHHPGITQDMIRHGMEPYRLHGALSDLLASSESGCHSCSVLVGRLDQEFIEKTPKDTPVFIENRPFVVPENIRFAKFMTQKMLTEPDLDDEADEGLPVTMVAVRTERDSEQPQFVDPKRDHIVRWLPFELRGTDRVSHSRHAGWITGTERRQISPTVDAKGNLKVIGNWLSSCLKRESECSNWPKEPFKPTRLIDVGSGESRNDTLRLVRGADIEEAFPGHVSLSYCWGSTGQHIRWITTRERLPEFEKVIPHEVLPKTIADAVKVVREIGIRYLWVDSLCIVQDDPDDWAYEAYRMAQVYNSSLFTVISGSDSAMGGLFLPREQLKVSAADILLQSNPEAGEHVATLYPSVQDIGTAHHGGPTTRRAWCYQEELLSPRRLYFTNRQFVWECLCSSHDETGSRSPGDTRSTKYCPPPYDADVLLRNTRVVGEWHSVIEEYTSRQLTYHSDVFAALAGVAASLKARYRCKYLAGMWEDDMLNGLLWQRAGTSLGRSAELNTPSWSWLSVQGQVMFTRGTRTPSRPDAEYLDCAVTTKDCDEFGTLTSGTLRLRARLLSCEVVQNTGGGEHGRFENIYQPLPEHLTPIPRRKHAIADGHEDQANSHGGAASGEEGASEDEPTYSLRSQAWESERPFRLPPPGGRLDMTASLKTRGPDGFSFATVFFDGEPQAKASEFLCAYIAMTDRPEDIVDRNGIAIVPVPSRHESLTYKRIGFVAFWDKLIQDNLRFLYDKKKTEFILV